ncbi:ActS/PrrB/RegB family redox-sensitive histidine kinase [Alphaproteobacteria bacterium]|nr:ActS/PrrB/RegB family redox-sensitive histidine kinase [Alphaproteobacteria bacterium]
MDITTANPLGRLSASAAHGRINLRTLVLIRWIAVFGQAATILLVHFWIGFSLPLFASLLAVAASAFVNLVALRLTVRREGQQGSWLQENDVALFLGFDIIQLAVLFWLTGGLTNPFCILILAPVTVSASVLSRQSTTVLSALALFAIAVLIYDHKPLPWGQGNLELPFLYIFGIGSALAISVIFTTSYVASLAAEARDVSNALTSAELALEREQKLSAVGGLAAAAAHELGTPLGTIVLVAKELAADLPKNSRMLEDANLLVSESLRCKEILTSLTADPKSDQGEAFNWISIEAIVQLASKNHRNADVDIFTDFAPFDDEDFSKQPLMPRSPEIIHGLGNIIQNAIQFANSTVTIAGAWDNDRVEIEVVDDGPGFDSSVLNRLGDPYVSTGSRNRKQKPKSSMGLGVFIAKTMLSHTGAEVEFLNSEDNGRVEGAIVRVVWPRSALTLDQKRLQA